MRILLISVFYPPQNAIASQRVHAWAKYWSRAGDEVTVLTPTKDLKRSDLSPKPLENVTVVEVAPSGLFRFLKRLVRSNAQPVGAVSKSDQKNAQARRGALHATLGWFTARGLFSSTRMPDAFDLWIPPALRAAREISCDVVVSTFGPYAPHVIAYFLKKRNPRLVWICDFRDLWVSNHIYAGVPGFRGIEKFLERRIVRACDFVVTVSEGLAEQLRLDHRGLDVRVVPNGFDGEDLENLPSASVFEPEFKSDGLKRIVYTGSIHLPTRDPSPLFAAAAKLSLTDRQRLRLVFIGPNSGLLITMAQKYGVADISEFQSSVVRQDALRAQRDADALLFLEANYSGSKDGVLTGKLFEYLSSGTPIIGVGIEASSAVGRLLEEFSAGHAYGSSVEGLTAALLKLLRKPGVNERVFNLELEKFSRKAQAAQLRAMITEKLQISLRDS